MIVTGKVPIRDAILDQWRHLLLVLVVALCVVELHEFLDKRWISIQVTPLTALGVALGVFLSLRNNVVWARYWEARSLWGRLINDSRTLPRQLSTLLADCPERGPFIREMCLRQIAFVKAFRAHLRNEDTREHLGQYLPAEELPQMREARNVPTALLHRMGERLRDACEAGMASELDLLRLDETMTNLTDILGGCEKIKNTPLPPAYTHLAHKILLMYCCLIPFGLVADIGIVTPVLSLAISFAFLTLDRTSDLIEQPFSTEVNDLPLNAMTRTIEIDLLQRMGEKDIPEPLKPVNGVLL